MAPPNHHKHHRRTSRRSSAAVTWLCPNSSTINSSIPPPHDHHHQPTFASQHITQSAMPSSQYTASGRLLAEPTCRSTRSRSYLTTAMIVLVMIAMLVAEWPVEAAQHSLVSRRPKREKEEWTPPDAAGRCQSRDLRNSIESFEMLRGCRIVEGFVNIVLMDNFDHHDPRNYTFPELTEITDYLLIYHVGGLQTLADVFPNLRVIRGNNLITDYALAMYENPHLLEVGLHRLTHILRGGVRIVKNPLLCFADTINWAAISANFTPFVDANQKRNECPLCPTGRTLETSGAEHLALHELRCPPKPNDRNSALCWNTGHCQLVCDASCGVDGTCSTNGTCCSRSCVGGCPDGRPDECFACRNLRLYDSATQAWSCVDVCPLGMYAFFGERCVTEDECHQLSKPFATSEDDIHRYPYAAIGDLCTDQCPSDYRRVDHPEKGRSCVPCEGGKCKKECHGMTVDSIATAQMMRACNVVKGDMIIHIRSQGAQNVVRELEKEMGDIEEITGKLKITRTFSLVSLSFFKSLKRIATELYDTEPRYGLHIFENQNLQELFSQNVTIESGRLFFHFNPKLCYDKIAQLFPHTAEIRNVTNVPVEDVAVNSNGDKVACSVRQLNIVATRIADVAAVLAFEQMYYPDERVLLGYVLHFTASLTQNVRMYEGRDGCGGDNWRVEDVSPGNNSSANHLTAFMVNLKPHTQYAYFLKTYTIASEKVGGQTPIQYLKTKPSQPERVLRLKATVLSEHSIEVTWNEPRQMNGDFSHYIIRARLLTEVSAKQMNLRNYCDNPLSTDEKIIQQLQPKQPELVPIDQCTCADAYSVSMAAAQHDEFDDDIFGLDGEFSSSTLAEQAILFENAMQNTIFVRRVEIKKGEEDQVQPGLEVVSDARRRRRRRRRRSNENAIADAKKHFEATTNIPMLMLDGASTTVDPTTATGPDGLPRHDVFPESALPPRVDAQRIAETTESILVNGSYVFFYQRIDENRTTFTLDRLQHFTTYEISVRACRLGGGPKPQCSDEMLVEPRTKKLEHADLARNLYAEELPASANISVGTVFLRWDAPVEVNGIIVSYTIQYKRLDMENAKGTELCVSHTLQSNFTTDYLLNGLDNGNYSFMVKATSLAGHGVFSEPVYLILNNSGLTAAEWAWTTVGILLLIVLLVGTSYFLLRRHFKKNVENMRLIATVNPEYITMHYQEDEWEVPRDNIVIKQELGQGSFGMVYAGLIKVPNGPDKAVAIKTVNDNSTDRERVSFLQEAAVMKSFKTFHVVSLIGVVSNGQPTLVVMELMVNGDLKDYLRRHRQDPEGSDPSSPNGAGGRRLSEDRGRKHGRSVAESTQASDYVPAPPKLSRILLMALQIADGMMYLSDKKFVHRDLAARNCMVAEDLTVKIGDFGLTRDVYETDYYRKGTKGLMPVRWMSPESLKDGIFTSASDMFSYGVVLWEMSTLASQPYQGLSNDQVLKYVIDGGVMERPENCPEVLYRLMGRTWQHRPSSRPTFFEVIDELMDNASDEFLHRSYFCSREVQQQHRNMGMIPHPRLAGLPHLAQQQAIAEPVAVAAADVAAAPMRAVPEDFRLESADDRAGAAVDESLADGGASGGDGAGERFLMHDLPRCSVEEEAEAEADADAINDSTPLSSGSGIGLRRLHHHQPQHHHHRHNNNTDHPPSQHHQPPIHNRLPAFHPANNNIQLANHNINGAGSINRGIEYLRNAFFGSYGTSPHQLQQQQHHHQPQLPPSGISGGIYTQPMTNAEAAAFDSTPQHNPPPTISPSLMSAALMAAVISSTTSSGSGSPAAPGAASKSALNEPPQLMNNQRQHKPLNAYPQPLADTSGNDTSGGSSGSTGDSMAHDTTVQTQRSFVDHEEEEEEESSPPGRRGAGGGGDDDSVLGSSAASLGAATQADLLAAASLGRLGDGGDDVDEDEDDNDDDDEKTMLTGAPVQRGFVVPAHLRNGYKPPAAAAAAAEVAATSRPPSQSSVSEQQQHAS